MCGLSDSGVMISTLCDNRSSKKKESAIKLSNVFWLGSNSTNKSMSLFCVCCSRTNDPNKPIF